MDDKEITATEIVPATRKLGRREAIDLVKNASRVIVARGRQVEEFEPGGKTPTEIVDRLLGPTGNLRAPTIRVGKTLLVGFNEDAYRSVMTGK